MKRNTRWYLSAAAAGALLAGAALWAARTFPAAPAAVPGFFGLAGGLLFFCAMAELLSTRDLDPARRERDREDHDERGAMIRAMARARAGDVLLWLLLFGAAYLYFFGVPKWVNITLLGLACAIAKPFKNRLAGVAVGTAVVCGIRFLCSFLSGIVTVIDQRNIACKTQQCPDLFFGHGCAGATNCIRNFSLYKCQYIELSFYPVHFIFPGDSSSGLVKAEYD